MILSMNFADLKKLDSIMVTQVFSMGAQTAKFENCARKNEFLRSSCAILAVVVKKMRSFA